jgi:hypothetical protein
MKTKIFNLLNSFRSSYWFVPTVMTDISIALSLGTTTFEECSEPMNRTWSTRYINSSR